MEQRIRSFEEFYPYYLSEHKNRTCRLLHVIGTTIVLALTLTALYWSRPSLMLYVPLAGYGFAWAGHYFFEKNKPATFKYPFWSLRADFKMYYEVISGKIGLDGSGEE